jgi:hypothetical protein
VGEHLACDVIPGPKAHRDPGKPEALVGPVALVGHKTRNLSLREAWTPDQVWGDAVESARQRVTSTQSNPTHFLDQDWHSWPDVRGPDFHRYFIIEHRW